MCKKMVAGFILGCICFAILATINSSRRTDFISGCGVGATFMAQTVRIPMPYDHVVAGCKQYYDTNKVEVNSILDEVNSKGI